MSLWLIICFKHVSSFNLSKNKYTKCTLLSQYIYQDSNSGVFSTGATGAIAPVILRKGLIAPVMLHLDFGFQYVVTKILHIITILIPSFYEGKLLQKFLLRCARMFIVLNSMNFKGVFLHIKNVQVLCRLY